MRLLSEKEQRKRRPFIQIQRTEITDIVRDITISSLHDVENPRYLPESSVSFELLTKWPKKLFKRLYLKMTRNEKVKAFIIPRKNRRLSLMNPKYGGSFWIHQLSESSIELISVNGRIKKAIK